MHEGAGYVFSQAVRVTRVLLPVLLLAGWEGNIVAPVSTSPKVRRRLAA